MFVSWVGEWFCRYGHGAALRGPSVGRPVADADLYEFVCEESRRRRRRRRGRSQRSVLFHQAARRCGCGCGASPCDCNRRLIAAAVLLLMAAISHKTTSIVLVLASRDIASWSRKKQFLIAWNYERNFARHNTQVETSGLLYIAR